MKIGIVFLCQLYFRHSPGLPREERCSRVQENHYLLPLIKSKMYSARTPSPSAYLFVIVLLNYV